MSSHRTFIQLITDGVAGRSFSSTLLLYVFGTAIAGLAVAILIPFVGPSVAMEFVPGIVAAVVVSEFAISATATRVSSQASATHSILTWSGGGGDVLGRSVPAGVRYRLVADVFERCFALILIILTLPIMAVSIVLVRITSPGPVIYRQTRVGRSGQIFQMYKLRTMRLDAEVGSGPVWSASNDPRVTPIGRILRQTQVDEFPQLFNILHGEMSLIGPRPERPEFVAHLSRAIPGYLGRLQLRPGMVGLAQLNLPPDTDLESVRRKLAFDLAYVGSANIWLDLRILLCTVLRVFGLSKRRATRLTGLHVQAQSLETMIQNAEHVRSTPLVSAEIQEVRPRVFAAG